MHDLRYEERERGFISIHNCIVQEMNIFIRHARRNYKM